MITRQQLNGTVIRINDGAYATTKDTPIKGDLVLDTMDGCYASVYDIHNNRAILKDGDVVEVGVSLDRLIKLRLLSYGKN